MRISKYSKEFRDSTVQLILNNNESVIKVASDLDINSKTLYHWVRMYKKSIIFQVKRYNHHLLMKLQKRN